MKGYIGIAAVVVILAALIIASGYFGLYDLLLIEEGCRIMKPVWGYYKCEKSSVPIDITDFKAVGWTNVYGTYYCTNSDIARNGIYAAGQYRSCSVSVTSPTAGSWVYKVCRGDTCDDYSGLQGGDYGTHTYYLDFGEYLVVSFQSVLVGTAQFSILEQYYQKQLVYHDWFGYESETQGIGCDIRSVLTSDKWNKLPADAKLSLNLDERQNFVVGWTDLATIGNYYTHPAYGDVYCTPQRTVYKLKPYQTANEEGETGTYYDQAGNCYIIPEANPIAIPPEVECCPGEIVGGFTCSSENKWVGADQGECCRGGICSAIHCPGGGSDFCDLSTHRVSRFECRESDGACVDVLDKYAECCPPDKGCSGNEYCDVMTYTCKDKPPGLLPCPFQCCVDPIVDTTYYQFKACDLGLACCPGGVCKTTCGIEPAEPDNEYLWLIIPILLASFALIGYLTHGILGGVIGAILGGLAGYLVFWWLSLAWWAQLLITLGLAGLGGLGLWIFGGAIAAMITAVFIGVMSR